MRVDEVGYNGHMGDRVDEVRLRLALDSGATATAFWRAVLDEHGQVTDLEVVECSVGFAEWLGRSHDSLTGRRYSELVPTGLHDRLPVYLDALRTGKTATLIFDRPGSVGEIVTAEVRVTPLAEDELFVALWDVTEREERVRSAERDRADALVSRDLLEAALNASPDGFVVLRREDSRDGRPGELRIEFLNEAGATPTNRSPAEWAGARLDEWFPEAEASGLLPVLLSALVDRQPRRVVVSMQSATGWVGRHEHIITPFGSDRLVVEWWPEDADTPPGIDAPAAVLAGSRRDVLTGLDNRGEFRRRLSEWSDQADARGAVLVVDLDDFGRLNDLVGGHRADEVLAVLGRALRALDPWLVLPARIGPDEFAGIVPGAVTQDQVDLALAHLNRILRDVSDRLGLTALSVSGGLREIVADHSVDDMLRDCDTALRHSVRQGGATVTLFTPETRADLLADFLVGEDIRTGLRGQEFHLAYQPIVRIETGAHIGDEALARWQHPEHGLLLPGRFISIAESTGCIVELGDWVLATAMADLGGAAHDRSVGVNISGVHLLQSDLASTVAAGLERHRIAPQRVVVEITESAIVPNSVRIREQLEELRQMGVQIAIDDFGSGYSSIGYLDWIPVDVVKLDMSFVRGELDRRRRGLIAATAQLVRSIGARSLVEGIETDEQWDVVREAGVDFGQGHLFGRPERLAVAA